MKKRMMKIGKPFLLFMTGLLVLWTVPTGYAQEIRWLRVSELQSFITEVGAEYENQGTSGNTNYYSWPAQFSIDQNTIRMTGLWMGCRNFDDPVENKVKGVKVIGSGPRNASDRVNQIFEQEIKLIGRNPHPVVIVDDQPATLLETGEYDIPDSLADDLPCDRMILVKFNTSMGISVTKKVMAFANPNHGNYFIHDYVFKNTGIYNRNGDVKQQTLQDAWFYWVFRYAFAGVSSSGFGSSWGAFASTWGNSTLNHAFGQNPAAPEFNDPNSIFYQLRGFYSWYGPSTDRPVSYEEDWGCPNENEDGTLGSAKYAGSVALHADTGPNNQNNDLRQPLTTWFIASDIAIMLANVSQYDEVFMADRWAAMTEGHPELQHDEVVGDDYPINYTDPRRNAGGGTSQGQGFGPYTLAPGDSIHIVFAQGVSGLSWEKGREVGGNWLQWFNNTGTPTLVNPDGTTTTDYNAYKKAWVFTGRDSILKTYRNAVRNYNSGYTLPQPPPPPNEFIVTSGGDRILLDWADNATADPHFDGYVIYRSEGNVLDWRTKYEKIFECDKSNVVHSFDDVTAKRGFDYYYYIQSKDDGTQNDVDPGKPLYSSLFWTITSVPATLQRPAVPDEPLAPDLDANLWKLTSDKGGWIAGTNYVLYDIVTLGGSNYVCIAADSASAMAPDLNASRWRLTAFKGEWISGSGYNVYDVVSYNGLNYVTFSFVSAGKGLELVRVVPNPYDIRSRLFQFGDKFQYDRIAFYGLPPVCKLKIFTERGDLIYEKDHTRGTGDELWDSTTSSGQIVASGIYILYVEVPGGGSVYRKFVVIR